METDNRFIAFVDPTNSTTKKSVHLSNYNTVRNVNAYTGEYYEKDKYSFLVLEDNSAKQFGDGLVFLGQSNILSSEYDKWDGGENFRRIAGGIG